MKDTLLVVDLSNQVYRALYAYPNLTHDGVFTGGLYGLLVMISTAVRNTNATRLIVAEDSKPYIRVKTYSAYKNLSRKPPDPAVKEARDATMQLWHEMATAVGICSWAIPGYEADDIAGLVVRDHWPRFRHVWSMSNDEDLYQLLTYPNYRVYASSSTKVAGKPTITPKVTTRDVFVERFGIDPEQYPLVLAMAGTHNDVEGIPSIGIKRAVAALQSDQAKYRQLTQQHGPLIARNLDLITLPHPSLPRTPLPPRPTFNLRALHRFCARYDITVTPSINAAFGNLL